MPHNQGGRHAQLWHGVKQFSAGACWTQMARAGRDWGTPMSSEAGQVVTQLQGTCIISSMPLRLCHTSGTPHSMASPRLEHCHTGELAANAGSDSSNAAALCRLTHPFVGHPPRRAIPERLGSAPAPPGKIFPTRRLRLALQPSAGRAQQLVHLVQGVCESVIRRPAQRGTPPCPHSRTLCAQPKGSLVD